MAEALPVTGAAVQASLAVAVTELLIEQASSGTVKLAVKLARAPGARAGTIKTVVSWLLITTTLFNATLPGFLTVPL